MHRSLGNYRTLLLILLLAVSHPIRANMAEPLTYGTQSALPFISHHVDIISEKLLIRPHSGFSLADIEAEYTISSDSSRQQVPMLFS